jgi:DNA ligase (NAD+)
MGNNLRDFLDIASKAYYEGNPIISDEVFDALADSINYANVGHRDVYNEEPHLYRMYSQQKHYMDEPNKPLSEFKVDELSISPKLDGASLAVVYVNGNLQRASTRGDGIVGKVVTHLFAGRPDLLPQTISYKDQPIQITFEAAAVKEIENSRNYAAGSLNLKDPEEFKTRAISLFAHGVSPHLTDTYEHDLITLKRMGFNTVKDKGLADIYPTDGVVYRVNDNKKYDELGHTAKFPRGAYALKERSEGVETTLLDVEWNTGKSGKVTPVAILDPIMIGDAKISRATLNNVGFIEALDLRIGDTVYVVRSGEIIPKITHKVG